MKLLLPLGLFAFLLFSTLSSTAQSAGKTKENKTKGKSGDAPASRSNAAKQGSLNMQGAYLMLRQVVNDGTKDSVTPNKQLKIYTDRYMMYAHPTAGDSLADFGIGTFAVKNGKVVEYVFHTAAGGTQKDTFELSINKTADGFSQVIIIPEFQGKRWTLTEDYKSVGKNIVTPLDGAWKQTKSLYIPKTGSTVTDTNPTQFKVYQSGYLIWARAWVDAATNQPVSSFGYGTFEMNSRNQSKETYSSSTSKTGLVGSAVMVQLEFMGKDAYQQTIDWPNGRSIEMYQRLK